MTPTVRNLCLVCALGIALLSPQARPARATVVSIQGREFLINGRPTYEGRSFDGMRVQGLLFNSRMVQGIFDDRNSETRGRWNYPDGPWDPERNTREFMAAMPLWKAKGLLAFTINLQGGSPEGYSRSQPWMNSSFETDGCAAAGLHVAARTHPRSRGRTGHGRDRRLLLPGAGATDGRRAGRDACGRQRRRTGSSTRDIRTCWSKWPTKPTTPDSSTTSSNPPVERCGLIDRVKERSKGKLAAPAGRLLVSTSLNGARVPSDSLVNAVDFVLLHGNGVQDPARITQMVDETRKLPSYRGQPIVFNEDDHFDFSEAAEQHARRAARLCELGILRLPDGRRAVRRRVPERAGQLDDQLAAEAGVLRRSCQG